MYICAPLILLNNKVLKNGATKIYSYLYGYLISRRRQKEMYSHSVSFGHHSCQYSIDQYIATS